MEDGSSSPSAAEEGESELRPPELLRPEQVREQARLGLLVLRAAALRRTLESQAELLTAHAPTTFGEDLELRWVLRNPYPDPLVLLRPEPGYAVEFHWELERWMPDGSRDGRSRNRLALEPREIRIPAGGVLERHFRIPLDSPTGASALWRTRLGVRFRCAGARLGDQELPLQVIQSRDLVFLSFPAGWKELAQDPLGALRRLPELPQPQLDRHLLVASALLQEAQRREGVRILAEALPRAVNPRRARTMTTALAWLTGLDLGPEPAVWSGWWRRQNGDG